MAKKDNPFFASLEANIRQASQEALVKSVVADPSQTIGTIMESLGESEDAKYLVDAFMDMEIGDIVNGAVAFMKEKHLAHQQSLQSSGVPEAVMPPAANSAPDKPTGKSKPKPSGKKSAPPRAAAADEGKDLSTPERLKAYEASIITALKQGKHVDEDSAISSAHLRKVVGGTSVQARSIIDPLIEAERLGFCGKARGTKYYIL